MAIYRYPYSIISIFVWSPCLYLCPYMCSSMFAGSLWLYICPLHAAVIFPLPASISLSLYIQQCVYLMPVLCGYISVPIYATACRPVHIALSLWLHMLQYVCPVSMDKSLSLYKLQYVAKLQYGGKGFNLGTN